MLDARNFEQYCYELGFFAYVGNRQITKETALSDYAMHNEVEVSFKLMLGHLLRTARVHSTAALDGALFTSFIGLSILTDMRRRMERLNSSDRPLKSLYTIEEVFKTLQRITLLREPNGRCRLLNVSGRDRQLVADLGFEGLFDSADAVYELLTARHLQDVFAKSQ